VSVAEADWEEWLHAVGNMKIVRDVELPVSLLAGDSNALKLAERYGLTVAHARDLLPSNTARYLGESPAAGRDDVLTCLKHALVRCRDAGARSVSLEMGLERIGDATFEQDLAVRVRLLRGLMPVADSHAVTVCVQVRHPPRFPGAKEWGCAGNLVHEVMHPRCRLALDVVPSELADGFVVEEFVRSCYFQAGGVRFHYDPSLGESPDPESQAEWAAALHRHGFRGPVVFRPRVTGEAMIAEACAGIDAWAELYSRP